MVFPGDSPRHLDLDAGPPILFDVVSGAAESRVGAMTKQGSCSSWIESLANRYMVWKNAPCLKETYRRILLAHAAVSTQTSASRAPQLHHG